MMDLEKILTLDDIVKRSEVYAKTGLAPGTIDSLESKGEFPQRIYLTKRCSVWKKEEVNLWLTAKAQDPLGAKEKITMENANKNNPNHLKKIARSTAKD
ncbi:helix-turn-helix transcriptional regulator [Arsenophonus sp. PmNCSU2021_1]|uniref:helix-turn-helix transcriptional regulator n=1 Tax=Arsenophonus sp. PmNCSU2021_1 TaxID=3118989 RepID=UPI002FEFCA1A